MSDFDLPFGVFAPPAERLHVYVFDFEVVSCEQGFEFVLQVHQESPSILYVLVPQTAQVPWLAFLPFFMVTVWALVCSVVLLHFKQ